MSLASLPDALKTLKPYLTLAGQLDQRNDKNIAYYCRLYAVQTGMAVNKTLPECKKFLFQLMDLIEMTKNQNKSDESIQSQVVGQTVVEQYALKIFDKADDDDRQARFSKNLVKAFYSAGLLFDVLNYFGELSEDLVSKKQYAKRKAMYLNRCFQTGEQPVPGPLVSDENEDDFGLSNLKIDSNQVPPSQHPPPSTSNTTILPTINNQFGSTRLSNEASNNFYYQDGSSQPDTSSSNNVTLPTDLMAKAQKLCKFAQSALQYEDVQTAITNLEQCLQILKSSK